MNRTYPKCFQVSSANCTEKDYRVANQLVTELTLGGEKEVWAHN